MTAPTDKQVGYALHLMDKAGYPTDWLSSAHKPLGKRMRDSGRVEDWLGRMSRHDVSKLIDQLRKEA